MNDLAIIVSKIKQLETEIERLKRVEYPTGGGGGGVTDHGQLTGLGDDDHPQYRLVADAIDHGALTGLGDNDHPQYLLTTGKAADSDKLDGVDSTGFVKTTGTQTVGGTKTFSSIPVLPATNPTTANQAVRKGFADATYLGISAKAADADKLDGLDSTDFGRPVFLVTPLTSTSWDGDAFSTTSKTLIDLSTVFGVPPAIKAILAEYSIKDSGSSNGTCRLVLSPNNINMAGVHLIGSPTNNHFVTSNAIIPCDVNGDIYYQIVASGTNTMTIYIQILGYWL